MDSTHYADSVGYDDDGTSTAIDLAKLTSKAIADPAMAKIIGTPLITVYSENGYYRYDLRNSNRLVADYQYPGSIGGKTGFTNAAGHCLISAAKRDGSTFVAVILHTISETNEASAVEARKLLENGFRLTRWN
jgi:D-alanyl-D-alanine carboxypeptidase (penicillin-binding protein 5/6)